VTRLIHQLRTDCRGAAVIEFAMVAPVFGAMLYGIVQLGIIFYAQAGLKSAVEDAARQATLWPRPTQSQLESRIAAKSFGMKAANITGPTVTFVTGSSPKYVTVTMSYTTSLNYILGKHAITFTETRRAYVTD
jgi:Flp pilus assembly protein TadG